MVGTVIGVVLALGGFTRTSPEYWQATPDRAVSGDASYYAPGIMAAVARRRGLDLSGYRGGVAMMRAGDLGREVWVRPILGSDGDRNRWAGPFLVVDCAQRAHYPGLVSDGRVIELDRRDWRALGLPNGLAPIVVFFERPRSVPRRRWR